MITETVKKRLIDTLLYSINNTQDETNPFVLDGEKAYMRYDAIRISQSDYETVTCEFLWNNTTVYTLNAAPEAIQFPDRQHITGPKRGEGRSQGQGSGPGQSHGGGGQGDGGLSR